MNFLVQVSLWFIIFGGLNWGLIGIFQFDIVAFLFGDGLTARVLYTIMGFSSFWVLLDSCRFCPWKRK